MASLKERRALLALMGVPHLGPVTLRRIFAEFGRGAGLAGFFDLPVDDLARRFRLRPDAVEALRDRPAWIMAEAASLERDLRERDVHWLVATDTAPALRWPSRLVQAPWSQPPVLFTRGNEDLLDQPAVAFLNSADAPPRALDVTDALADRLAAQGVAVVSGHNTRGYKAAAVAAVRQGSPRLLVLDRGLIAAPDDTLDREPVAPARVWSPEWDGLAGLAVSPFRPRNGWAPSNSRCRDELVAALATLLVAVHVRPGGVMEGIARAGLASGMRVAVWEGSTAAGSAALVWDGSAGVIRLSTEAGVTVTAERLVEELYRVVDGREGPGSRRSRRWSDRERHFLYSLLEVAHGKLLDPDRLLDFADTSRPRRPGSSPGCDAAVCDATGLRDPRLALETALDGLTDGGWVAALVSTGTLAGDEPSELRGWLAGRGRVAAIVSLPARSESEGNTALLLRKCAGPGGAVLEVAPEARIADATRHHRYLMEARARVQAHLTHPG